MEQRRWRAERLGFCWGRRGERQEARPLSPPPASRPSAASSRDNDRPPFSLPHHHHQPLHVHSTRAAPPHPTHRAHGGRLRQRTRNRERASTPSPSSSARARGSALRRSDGRALAGAGGVGPAPGAGAGRHVRALSAPNGDDDGGVRTLLSPLSPPLRLKTPSSSAPTFPTPTTASGCSSRASQGRTGSGPIRCPSSCRGSRKRCSARRRPR